MTTFNVHYKLANGQPGLETIDASNPDEARKAVRRDLPKGSTITKVKVAR